MVCGQCLAAMVIDHYGLMGMERNPAKLQRVIGVALVAAGAAVLRLPSGAESTS
jgi:bacterial/archaeal transporter family-2 protein